MDKAKRLLQRQPSYQPINDGPEIAENNEGEDHQTWQQNFSPVVYGVFLLLGVAMLWPWNSFMSAAPYFQFRFQSSRGILSNFQAAELSVSTLTNLASVWVLAKLQAGASYPRRIISSLVINTITFAVVGISTRTALGISPGLYLAFLIIAVFATSLATGFMQNGAFAYVAGYQRSEYMQAIMLGQAVAGVLPPIVQIGSVLSASNGDEQSTDSASTSAFAYFLTAAGVSALTMLAFLYLKTAHRPANRTPVPPEQEQYPDDRESEEDPLHPSSNTQDSAPKKQVPLLYLAQRLVYPGAAVFLTFGVTMVFPVFTQEIFTTNPNPPPILREASFIPLGLLVWNSGDLAGRLVPLASRLSLAHRPKILFALSIARIVFIPLYLLCNIVPAEESPSSAAALARKAMPDLFYWAIVQLPFGLSNGYLGSCCMMGAGNLVEPDEREASGAFMGLLLVAGLAVGSFCSFFVGNG